MSVTETDIEDLKTDFYRFAKLHSWYKHVRLEGATFVFFKKSEQQVRYDFDKRLTVDTRTDFWHFVRLPCKKYLKELSDNGVVLYQANFGPFLRGIERNGQFHGIHIILAQNKHTFEYLHHKYKYFTTNEVFDVNDDDINEIKLINRMAASEQTEYLNNALQFEGYQCE